MRILIDPYSTKLILIAMSDKEILLIQQAKNGSVVAFDELYQMYVHLIRNIIRKYYKQPEVIEELVVTTFLKAHTKLHTFITNTSFKSWLCTIASRSTIDYKRKKDRLIIQSLDDESLFVQAVSTNPNVEESIVKTEELRELRHCITLLPKKQQDIINMFYFQNKLYREIAKELELPLGTVQSDLNRAKHKLKQLLTV